MFNISDTTLFRCLKLSLGMSPPTWWDKSICEIGVGLSLVFGLHVLWGSGLIFQGGSEFPARVGCRNLAYFKSLRQKEKSFWIIWHLTKKSSKYLSDVPQLLRTGGWRNIRNVCSWNILILSLSQTLFLQTATKVKLVFLGEEWNDNITSQTRKAKELGKGRRKQSH